MRLLLKLLSKLPFGGIEEPLVFFTHLPAAAICSDDLEIIRQHAGAGR
jgi:hypothetical protein